MSSGSVQMFSGEGPTTFSMELRRCGGLCGKHFSESHHSPGYFKHRCVWVLWGDCLRNRPEVYTGTLSALSLLLCRWTWKIEARWQISAVHSDTVIRNQHCSLFIFEIRVRWRPKQKRTLSTARSHSKPVRRACNVNPGLTKTEFTCMGRFLSEPEFSLFSLFCGSFWETGLWKILDLHHSQSTSADIFDFTFGSIPPGCFPRKANKWIYADLRYFGRGANE